MESKCRPYRAQEIGWTRFYKHIEEIPKQKPRTMLEEQGAHSTPHED